MTCSVISPSLQADPEFWKQRGTDRGGASLCISAGEEDAQPKDVPRVGTRQNSPPPPHPAHLFPPARSHPGAHTEPRIFICKVPAHTAPPHTPTGEGLISVQPGTEALPVPSGLKSPLGLRSCCFLSLPWRTSLGLSDAREAPGACLVRV